MPAVELADVLPVATKVAFDREVGAVLATLRTSAASEVLEAVRQAVSDLVPGEDPLRTVEATVRAMAGAVDGVDPGVRADFDALLTATTGDRSE